MTNEQIKEKVAEIENLSSVSRLDDAAVSAMEMSKCDDLYAIQSFLIGLSERLKKESSTMLSIWSRAYNITNDKEEDTNAE